MKMCDYGCGQEAKFKLKNGKMCCAENWQGCLKYKNIWSIRSKKLWNNENSIFRQDNIQKKINDRRIMTVKKIKNKYPLFYKIEYIEESGILGKFKVHCKNHNCKNSKEKGGFFIASYYDIRERIRAINREFDGHYIYCSEKCKQSCILYGKTSLQLIKEDQIRVGIIKEEYYTKDEYNIWRQEVLKRAEYKCEYCGQEAEHCHHSKPQKLEPFFSLDPDYGIACCKDCHYKYGHIISTECSTGNLANKIC